MAGLNLQRSGLTKRRGRRKHAGEAKPNDDAAATAGANPFGYAIKRNHSL